MYLNQINFAGTDIVKQQSVKCPVVAITIRRAHGWTWAKQTLEHSMLANTTKTEKRFNGLTANCCHFVQKLFYLSFVRTLVY